MQSSTHPICRHTKTDGRRCQSPALATSAFCSYHQKLRRTRPRTISSGPGLSTRISHSLESRQVIQRAISVVYSDVQHGRITHARAKKILNLIRMAQNNLSQLGA